MASSAGSRQPLVDLGGNMRPGFILFLILIASASLVFPASADISITFADLNLIKGVKVLVYNNTGSLQGEYNTTDTATLNASQNYIFILKPTEQAWFMDPMNALELFKATIPVALSYLLFAVVVVATGFLVTRIWR